MHVYLCVCVCVGVWVGVWVCVSAPALRLLKIIHVKEA